MASRVKRPSYKDAKSALILGAGYTARTLIPALQARGYRVSATKRTKPLNIGGVTEISTASGASSDFKTAFESADVIVTSIPPFKTAARFADPALALVSGLTPRARWIGYLSATSVYGDLGGGWADETSPISPSLQRGKARAQAEIAWIETGWPVHIFRLAGIYGPERNPFARVQNGSARAVIKTGHVVNRIHVDDIAAALLLSIGAPNPQAIYNLADGNPAPPQDVLLYAAKLIGAAAPKTVSMDSPDVSAMARTFYAETKRIDASRARSELGWAPKYASYQAGLRAILSHIQTNQP